MFSYRTTLSIRQLKPVPRAKQRLGGALVEFAVCLPVIMVLLLGSMEATSAIFVRQALATSAYEGIREATNTGSSSADAIARAQRVLQVRGILAANISLTPAEVYGIPRGSNVVIEVSASYASNSPFFGNVIADRTTTVRTVMSKE
jgi:Flp pilus assembly protein TadG